MPGVDEKVCGERSNNIIRRMDELGRTLRDASEKLEETGRIQERILERLDTNDRTCAKQEEINKSLYSRIDDLKAAPGKRWDTLVVALIGTVVGAVVGILAQMAK